jgi:hypothetical protein
MSLRPHVTWEGEVDFTLTHKEVELIVNALAYQASVSKRRFIDGVMEAKKPSSVEELAVKIQRGQDYQHRMLELIEKLRNGENGNAEAGE